MAQSNDYQAHGARTGGLQGHSVSEQYPYTVIMVGSRWHAFDCRSGSTGRPQMTYQLAQMDVVTARIRNMMHS